MKPRFYVPAGRHIARLSVLLMAFAVASCGGRHSASLPPISHNSGVHYRALQSLTSNLMYNAPEVVTGSVPGTACFLTHYPQWIGDWPAYRCYMQQNDSVTLGNLVQVPMANGGGGYCGPSSWYARVASSAGNYPHNGSVSPQITGQGDWNCLRPDVVNFTFTRGSDSGGWEVIYQPAASYMYCDTVNCAGPDIE